MFQQQRLLSDMETPSSSTPSLAKRTSTSGTFLNGSTGNRKSKRKESNGASQQKEMIEKLVLWRQPFKTLQLAAYEIWHLSTNFTKK